MESVSINEIHRRWERIVDSAWKLGAAPERMVKLGQLFWIRAHYKGQPGRGRNIWRRRQINSKIRLLAKEAGIIE